MRTVLAAALAFLASCAAPPPRPPPAPRTQEPRHTPPAVTRTFVQMFQPAGIAGPEKDGECWTGSIAAQRPGAYRCAIGNGIVDPCFAIPRDRTAVICGARPGDEAGAFLLRLTKPLPAVEVEPPPQRWPWMFVLADGSKCTMLTGTCPFTADETARWWCDDDDGTYLLGEPRRGDVWTVRKVLLDFDEMPAHVLRSSVVAVRAVWQ